MQQTEKYKLNLIERNDPFSPDALNQNTQKVEDAMAAHEAGIEQRLTVLEAHRIAYGTYTGNGQNNRFIFLPFTPKLVVLIGSNVAATHDNGNAVTSSVKLGENGFTVVSTNYYNHEGWPCTYIAFS